LSARAFFMNSVTSFHGTLVVNALFSYYIDK
jgi:hypothetical protein